jgi:hypothetical protein
MARPRKSPEEESYFRGYRFNKRLLAEFEHDCARHFSNPKLILEGLMLHWLNTKPTERDVIAQRHLKRFGDRGGAV